LQSFLDSYDLIDIDEIERSAHVAQHLAESFDKYPCWLTPSASAALWDYI